MTAILVRYLFVTFRELRGLFFIAKFPKNFKDRTFILPNNFVNKITPQSWRGQIINLEDPEFKKNVKNLIRDKARADLYTELLKLVQLAKLRTIGYTFIIL